MRQDTKTDLFKLIDIDFKGIINVGRKKISDYSNYKKFKKNLRPCDKAKILINSYKCKLNKTNISINIDIL